MSRFIFLVLSSLYLFHTSAQDVRWFVIDSPEDLVWLSRPELLDSDGDGLDEFPDLQSKWSGNYFLADSIVFNADSSEVDWNGDGLVDHTDLDGFHGIGTEEFPFKGYFDGAYNVIKNLYITGAYERNGLFGAINGATIECLKLEALKVYSNTNYNGGIVGRADKVMVAGDSNMIRRCSVRGIFVLSNKNDNLYSGGIIGRTDNTQIVECASFVSMLAIGDSLDNRRVGGIVGQISGSASIVNSYSISTVSAYEQSGLIVARSYDDNGVTIRNCYSSGSIRSTSDPSRSSLGVFAGMLGTPGIVSCYFDSSLSKFPGVGESDSPVDVIGLPTAGFSEPGNFSGWDFNETWKMKQIEFVLRPGLIWEDSLGSTSKVPRVIKSAPGLAPVHQWERTYAPVFLPEKVFPGFLVYPNPTTHFIQIDSNQYPNDISIYNLMGQKVLSRQIYSDSERIDVSCLPSGMYILKSGHNSEVFIVSQ